MKIKTLLAGLLLLCTSITATTVLASEGAVQKELCYNNIKITLNGVAVTPTDANGSYVEPFIIDGTTYLPVRAVAGTVGLNVDWDGATNTVILTNGGNVSYGKDAVAVPLFGNVKKNLVYNNIRITVNGTELVPADANGNYVEPFIIDGTTYLPVRAVASFLGLDVKWDNATSTVMLNSPDKVPVSWSLEDGVLTVSGEGKMEEIFKIMYHTTTGGNGVSSTRAVFHAPWEKKLDRIKEVRISEGIIDITAEAFSGCTNLTAVSLPSSMRTIGMHAFSGTSLVSVTIPEGVGKLDYGVFTGCSELTDIYIPSTVAEIPFDSFWNCKKLGRITVSAENPYFCDVDGVLYNKDKTEILYYPISRAGEEYIVPDGVEIIGDSAFNLCKLKKVVLPDSVTEIKENAFYQANKIEELNIPKNVREIGKFAFAGCQSLKSIAIPDGITVIKEFCFNNCIELREVIIPDSVTEIGARAFQSCSFRTIKLPKNLKSIGSYAFSGCWYLNMDLDFPETLEFIGEYAFSSCRTVKKINIGKNVSAINSGAFSTCVKAVISVDAENPYFVMDERGAIYTSDMTRLVYYPLNNGEKFYNIPEGVKIIDNAVFVGTSVETVKLPVSLERINDAAFSSGCNVKVIHYPGTPEQFAGISLGEMNLIDGMHVYLNWGEGEFCPLCGGTDHSEHTREMGVRWNVSMDVLMVGGYGNMSDLLFTGADGIVRDPEWLEKSKDSVVAVSVNGEIKDVCFKAFAGITSLTSVSLCDGIESVGAVAFADNPNLQSITLPSTVKSIGAYAFRNCTSLETIAIPSKVNVIMQGLFSGCSSLKKVSLPGDIHLVADGVFEGCDSLEVIYFGGPREKWERLAHNFGDDIDGVKVICQGEG